MVIKISDRKIKHQLNVQMFVWDRDNLTESKPKLIMNINSKLIKCWRIILIKKRFNWKKKK
jgi:hypothetical protein